SAAPDRVVDRHGGRARGRVALEAPDRAGGRAGPRHRAAVPGAARSDRRADPRGGRAHRRDPEATRRLAVADARQARAWRSARSDWLTDRLRIRNSRATARSSTIWSSAIR